MSVYRTPDYLRPTRAEAEREAWDMGEHPVHRDATVERFRRADPEDHAPDLLEALERAVLTQQSRKRLDREE